MQESAISKTVRNIGVRFVIALSSLFIFGAAHSKCQPFEGFRDNGDGTLTDTRYGTVWQRCAYGFTWTGQTCAGKARANVTWFEAMELAKSNKFLGFSDWRLPTKEELESVVGQYSECKANDFERVGQYAASLKLAHPLGWPEYPSFPGIFWSSSPGKADDRYVFTVSFGQGRIDTAVRESVIFKFDVRLVRTSVAPPKGAVTEFDREYSNIRRYKEAYK